MPEHELQQVHHDPMERLASQMSTESSCSTPQESSFFLANAEQMQSLPPELFREIYELTFLVEPAVVVINSLYKPPSCFRLSRSTRMSCQRLLFICSKRRSHLAAGAVSTRAIADGTTLNVGRDFAQSYYRDSLFV